MPNGHLSLVLLLLPMATAQQQFSGIVNSFPQAQFQPFGSFGLPMQHPFAVGQAPQFGLQPVQPVQTFQNPFQPAVQPQFNSFFPALTLPSFTLSPPVQPFNPFAATVAPIYNTNQLQQQNLQPQQNVLPQQNVQPQQNLQPQQPVQPQQGQQFQQPQPLPPAQPQVEAPTTLVAVQDFTTPPTTRPTPEPTTTVEETTSLPVVDARSEPKKKKTTTKVVKVTEDVPPEAPKELKNMHDNDEEEEVEEQVNETASQETRSTESHRSRIHASGSASPRVLDFRSINVGKTTTPTPLSVLRAASKAKEEEQREVDEILNRVLDAVAPMHRPVESGESAGISGESSDF